MGKLLHLFCLDSSAKWGKGSYCQGAFFFFSSKIAGAIIALVLTALALGEAVAWCSGVRQLWEGESHQRPLHPRRGLSFDPGDAEDASGITFGVPYSEEVG